jgi:hypothetical protein
MCFTCALRVIGDFQSISPSNKKLSFDGMDFLTITNAKITEEWVSIDTMGLMEQIGAISAASLIVVVIRLDDRSNVLAIFH